MTKDCSWNYHENYKRRTRAEHGHWVEHVLPMFCSCSFHGNSMKNLLSYCAQIRDSDKDLPVQFDVIYFKDKQSQDKKRNVQTRICRFFQVIKNTKRFTFSVAEISSIEICLQRNPSFFSC